MRTARPLKGHAYHGKSNAELMFIRKDAHEAYAAISTFDERAAAKYLDQINDAETVLHYRSATRQPEPMF